MNETNRSALWAAMMGTLGASLVVSGACGQAVSPVDATADASAVDSRPAADAPPIPLAGPQVYWTDKARATIERYAIDVDATAAVLQASEGLVDPRGIAIDRATGMSHSKLAFSPESMSIAARAVRDRIGQIARR